MAAIVLAKITLSIPDHPLSIYTSLMQGFYSVAVCDPSSVGGRHPLRRHRIRGEIETAWSVELSEVRRRSCVQHYLTKRPANTSGSGSRVDIASNHSLESQLLNKEAPEHPCPCLPPGAARTARRLKFLVSAIPAALPHARRGRRRFFWHGNRR